LENHKVFIDSLHLVDFKRFRDSKINFTDQLTVLVGRNGAGKSSILSGISLVLSWIIARLRNDSANGQYIPALSVHNHARNGFVEAQIFGDKATIPNKARPGLLKEYNLSIAPIKEYTAEIRHRITREGTCPLPVFAYYGVARAVIDIPLRVRAHEFTPFDAYDRCLEGAANFRSFFTWFRACEDWENEQNARHAHNRTEHAGLKAFRRAMRIFMPEYDDIKIRRHPLAMTICKNGAQLNVEQLSDGEKIYLALIGDMCHRLSLANPHTDPLKGQGIVLIDEIDLHLHPQWQSEIAQRLTSTFPNIQFIVTTHSPHVLNRVSPSSVRILESDNSISEPAYAYGMPSEIVLKDLMSLTHDIPDDVKSAIELFYSAIAEGDTSAARQSLENLSTNVPRHPELPRMRKILEKMSR